MVFTLSPSHLSPGNKCNRRGHPKSTKCFQDTESETFGSFIKSAELHSALCLASNLGQDAETTCLNLATLVLIN